MIEPFTQKQILQSRKNGAKFVIENLKEYYKVIYYVSHYEYCVLDPFKHN
jgi:hypothetical protein